MQKTTQLNDRSSATTEASLRARIERLSELDNIFKTQPFSAAC
jgi:hypothetical protein